MSDLLIRNFDPPKYGYREIRIHPNGRITEVNECGLDEVIGIAEYIPPHGDLIERDAARGSIKPWSPEDERNGCTFDTVKKLMHTMLDRAPTIIPAEPNQVRY